MKKFDLKNSELYKIVDSLIKEDFVFFSRLGWRFIYCKKINLFVVDPSAHHLAAGKLMHPDDKMNGLYKDFPRDFLCKKQFVFSAVKNYLSKYNLDAGYILNGNLYLNTDGGVCVYASSNGDVTTGYSWSSSYYCWTTFSLDLDESMGGFNPNCVEDWIRLCLEYDFEFSSLYGDLSKKFLKLEESSSFTKSDVEFAKLQFGNLREVFDKDDFDEDSSEEIIDALSEKMLSQALLDCDKCRADLEPYDEKMLYDPNQGHWELYGEPDEFQCLVPRDPHKDVRDDGVVGIDFGTKSTVVVYQSGSNRILPMRVGTGELKKAASSEQFENPTVVELIDLKSFLDDYAEGWRPETSWDDFKISHQANSDYFERCNYDKGEYSAFFSDLKQWAGNTTLGRYTLRDKNGLDVDLLPYDTLGENDLDPIELYAYYLGLYINNMHSGHGIFLKYYLSFPVTYEMNVQKRIVESFKKGLKKSFPKVIAEDEALMARFDVNGEVNEPAAYAVCALLEYGFEPQDDKKIYYGIFDFGGGTTDFDFGEWSVPSKRRYDYKISHFGAQGDKFLGGENLLKYVAFDIFKNNRDLLLEKNISFTAPTAEDFFVGAEKLISSSNVAMYNTKNLMEVVRPIWEGTEGNDEGSKIIDEDSKIMVSLLHNDGEMESGVRLDVSRERIVEILRSRIDSGIEQFFRAFEAAFANRGDHNMVMDKMHVLLAGNSSKSPLVKECFEKHIAEFEKQSQKKDLFVLLPPIGSEEFYAAKEKLNSNFKREDDSRDPLERPTGKTGVAFGLLLSRKGGKIEVENLDVLETEIPFKFYLGYESRGKFQLLKDDSQTMKVYGKIDLGVWYEFYDVVSGDDYVEVFFSDAPDAVTNKKPIENIKKKICEFEKATEDALFFVKAVDPHTIEFAVAKDRESIDKSKIYKMTF